MTYQLISIAGLMGVMACGPAVSDDPFSGEGDGGNSGADARSGPDEFADARTPEPCAAIDILFVIDDSGSMRHERDNLRANFAGFIGALDTFQTSAGAGLDYRVGVTSTTVDHSYIDRGPIIGDVPVTVDGQHGALIGDCGMVRPWLERGDADVAGTFSCIADLNAAAGVLEMPLRATELALTTQANGGPNAGFVRDDALLAVVIVTDEDDCSRNDTDFVLEGGNDRCTDPDWPELQPIAHYAEVLDTVKQARGRWAVAAIGGVCADDTHDARPAVRLQALVDEAGDNGVFASICGGGDLTGPLDEALSTFQAACDVLPPIP